MFFLGGGIAFSALLAAVPFLLLLLGLVGFLLPQLEDPSSTLLAFIMSEVPASVGSLDPGSVVGSVIEGLVRDRAGFSVVGALLFLWFSTRLAGSLRIGLRKVFSVEDGHGIVMGKAFDSLVVLVGTALAAVNYGVTVFIAALGSQSFRRIGVPADLLGTMDALLVRVLGAGAIWVCAFLIYRLVTERPISFRTAAIAATLMALIHEGLKLAFGWYVTSVATYSSVYGNLATLAVTLFWIYYMATAFLFSGLVAEAMTAEELKGPERVMA